MQKLELPTAPPSCVGSVKAWSEPVTLTTYEPMAPDPNPMFLENRVYQGSSGRVYPLPFIDRIASEPKLRQWQALHLENEFIRVMILPEIGGRIHVGLDKLNGYDFFYRQNVIKPALVGLAGPWISGGVEFNWPQHHRPATFMPVNTAIERHQDGSITIWCSDHDPMERMRGTHGVCLHPGRAVLEVKVRLFNRTPFTQTFLWWANVATHVNENYQAIFPPDVRFVADHARRATTSFPLCNGTYYGIDYGSRASSGIPEEERPSHYVPRGDYAANDLSRYANIPVPTSYMASASTHDFLAGYDHGIQAGVVHVSDHHISPGKKQWTWGNHEFGYAWDRNLTDSDGPYVELMAGVYTDNQPDFSFLAPFETKTFSQYWFPIRSLSEVQEANVNAAAALRRQDGEIIAEVFVTRAYLAAKVAVTTSKGDSLVEWVVDLTPEATFRRRIASMDSEVGLSVTAQDRSEIIRLDWNSPKEATAPAPATEPPMPDKIDSLEELYLTGLHLDQYRHATRRANIYWEEALRRDSSDCRSNTAMGKFYLSRGEFKNAEEHLRRAISTLQRFNGNPADGEPFYLLGLTLRYLGDKQSAYAAFYKATWNQAWVAAGYLALAEMDAAAKLWTKALTHVARALAYNSENLNARNLKALILGRLGRHEEAEQVLEESLALDPLDAWTHHMKGSTAKFPNQQLLDVAFDCSRAGFLEEAVHVLRRGEFLATDGSAPILLYALASFQENTGHAMEAKADRALAVSTSPRHCFPSRLEELILLEEQTKRDPSDAAAFYFLGNLLYDRRRHEEAIAAWSRSAELNPAFPTVWRNLGVAFFNILQDQERASQAFEKALAADGSDARILFERDQLWKRLGRPLNERLSDLHRAPELVERRDDLSVELATLYNQTAQPEKALALLLSRSFQPWEGGEGLAIAQYVRASLALGRKALLELRHEAAIQRFHEALEVPSSLGEAKHVLANQNNIYYWLGAAYELAGRESDARMWWRRSVAHLEDFQHMAIQPYSVMTFYAVISLLRLREVERSLRLTADLHNYARRLARQKAQIDYFATSLPTMLLFQEDLQKRQSTTVAILRAQADLAAGQSARAARTFRRVLRDDPSHEVAFDMLQELPLLAEQILQNETSVDA